VNVSASIVVSTICSPRHSGIATLAFPIVMDVAPFRAAQNQRHRSKIVPKPFFRWASGDADVGQANQLEPGIGGF